jgi:hypothetical protein
MIYSDEFDHFWAAYGSDDRMDVTSKGSKRKAFEAWTKACKKWSVEERLSEPDEKRFAETVLHGYSLHANNRRNARRVPNKFVPPLPMMATYLNQFRFEAEVTEGSGDLRYQASSSSRACSCGGEFFGVDPYGKPQCRACHIEEWKTAIKRSIDPLIMKWRPQFMLDRYPKQADETWAAWSARTAKQILRDAPPTSPLGAIKKTG